MLLSDLSILKEMSQESFDTEKINSLVVDQMDLLKHAMKCKFLYLMKQSSKNTIGVTLFVNPLGGGPLGKLPRY